MERWLWHSRRLRREGPGWPELMEYGLLALALAIPASAAPAQVAAQTLAVTGATVIDPLADAPLTNGMVVMEDGRITAVGAADAVDVPAGTELIDARGKYVVPGLMDGNLHLFLNLDLETLIKYEGRYHEIVLEAAQLTLKDGADDRLRHLGTAGRAGGSARHHQRGRGAREPHLFRRQHHRLRRASLDGLPRRSGGARQQVVRTPHQRGVGARDGPRPDVDDARFRAHRDPPGTRTRGSTSSSTAPAATWRCSSSPSPSACSA